MNFFFGYIHIRWGGPLQKGLNKSFAAFVFSIQNVKKKLCEPYQDIGMMYIPTCMLQSTCRGQMFRVENEEMLLILFPLTHQKS